MIFKVSSHPKAFWDSIISSQKAGVPTLDKWDAEAMHLPPHAHFLCLKGKARLLSWFIPHWHWHLESVEYPAWPLDRCQGSFTAPCQSPETATITARMRRTVNRIITSKEPQLTFLSVLQTVPQPLIHSSEVTLLVWLWPTSQSTVPGPGQGLVGGSSLGMVTVVWGRRGRAVMLIRVYSVPHGVGISPRRDQLLPWTQEDTWCCRIKIRLYEHFHQYFIWLMFSYKPVVMRHCG